MVVLVRSRGSTIAQAAKGPFVVLSVGLPKWG